MNLIYGAKNYMLLVPITHTCSVFCLLCSVTCGDCTVPRAELGPHLPLTKDSRQSPDPRPGCGVTITGALSRGSGGPTRGCRREGVEAASILLSARLCPSEALLPKGGSSRRTHKSAWGQVYRRLWEMPPRDRAWG